MDLSFREMGLKQVVPESRPSGLLEGDLSLFWWSGVAYVVECVDQDREVNTGSIY